MKRIPQSVRDTAWQLYHNEEYSIKEVSQMLRISVKSAWLFTIGREMGFKTNSEYESSLLSERGSGFKSITSYHNSLNSQKRLKEENQALAKLISSSRKYLGKGQVWLAKQVGVSRQMIDLYEKGISIPNYERLHLLLSILKVRKIPKSLEEIV